jgi:hypothetical protein
MGYYTVCGHKYSFLLKTAIEIVLISLFISTDHMIQNKFCSGRTVRNVQCSTYTSSESSVSDRALMMQ